MSHLTAISAQPTTEQTLGIRAALHQPQAIGAFSDAKISPMWRRQSEGDLRGLERQNASLSLTISLRQHIPIAIHHFNQADARVPLWRRYMLLIRSSWQIKRAGESLSVSREEGRGGWAGQSRRRERTWQGAENIRPVHLQLKTTSSSHMCRVPF